MDRTASLLQERGKQWGDAVTTHERIAEMWSGILGHEVTAHQVALCMTGLKLVRASINPGDSDSLDDAAGYTRIGQMVMGHSVQPVLSELDGQRVWQWHTCQDCIAGECPGHLTPVP